MKFPLVIVALLAGFLLGCQGADQDNYQAPPKDDRFRTTAPSQLYFKNIRSSSYLLTEMEATKTNIYRLRQWPEQAKSPFISANIVDNWLHDQAYIQLQLEGEAKELPWRVLARTDFAADTLVLVDQTWGSQYEFGLQLYEQLLAGHPLSILSADGSIVDFFADEKERTAFRISFNDYLTFTEKR